jgi:hypothetical protein
MFVVPTISFGLLNGLLILRQSRRELLWLGVTAPFGQKTHLTAFSCGLLMITQEPAQSVAALDAPLSIEVTVPRK